MGLKQMKEDEIVVVFPVTIGDTGVGYLEFATVFLEGDRGPIPRKVVEIPWPV
jgi:hypothetical protein